nr:unnamed protein product [Digitaria exilis]
MMVFLPRATPETEEIERGDMRGSINAARGIRGWVDLISYCVEEVERLKTEKMKDVVNMVGNLSLNETPKNQHESGSSKKDNKKPFKKNKNFAPRQDNKFKKCSHIKGGKMLCSFCDSPRHLQKNCAGLKEGSKQKGASSEDLWENTYLLFPHRMISVPAERASRDRKRQVKTMQEPEELSFKDLREITNGFSEKVGEGGFGTVYKGVAKTGKHVAVKILRDVISDLNYEQFRNEFRNLTKVQHDNIVQFLGYCCEREQTRIECNGRIVLAENMHRALCFEFMHNRSLQKHLSGKQKLEGEVADNMQQ